jgi:hypothetical protein
MIEYTANAGTPSAMALMMTALGKMMNIDSPLKTFG